MKHNNIADGKTLKQNVPLNKLTFESNLTLASWGFEIFEADNGEQLNKKNASKIDRYSTISVRPTVDLLV